VEEKVNKNIPLQSIIIVIIVTLLFIPTAISRDYVVYSIAHELPMGDKPPEKLRKNYYLNIGRDDGVKPGIIMDVFRIISRTDQYREKKRFTHKVKIGALKILHSEESTSIAKIEKLYTGEDFPLFDIESVMIGDHVSINIKKEL
jgi:hypothetical protein